MRPLDEHIQLRIAHQFESFVRESDRPVLVELFCHVEIDEPVGNPVEIGSMEPVIVVALTRQNVEDGVAPDVSRVEFLVASPLAFEAEMSAKTPIRQKVVLQLTIDGANAGL